MKALRWSNRPSYLEFDDTLAQFFGSITIPKRQVLCDPNTALPAGPRLECTRNTPLTRSL